MGVNDKNDEYKFIMTENGSWRCIHRITGEGFGRYYQEKVRSMEYKSSYIVYRKYKNKMNLEHEDLQSLIEFAKMEIEKKSRLGKNMNSDHLVQLCSAEIKRRTEIKIKIYE